MKKGIVFLLGLGIISICCNVNTDFVLPPDVTYVSADGSVPERTHLQQDWSPDIREKFWFTSQGAHIMPYSWFTWLEQPDNSELFRNTEHMESLGYLPMKSSAWNPSGLPIGFAMSRAKSAKDAYMGFTCAACHTNQINFKGQKYLVDGAPTLANFVLFFDKIVSALHNTHDDPVKFERFARRVLQGNYSNSTAKDLKSALLEAALAAADRQKVNSLPNGYPSDFTSFGRLDAFGNIENAGAAFALGDLRNGNPPAAPVSYPFLWGTHQSNVVQWNASAPNTPLVGPLVRNTGEVVGVFGGLTIKEANWLQKLFGKDHIYSSTVDFHGLGALEGYVKILRSPRWSETTLPSINASLRDRGGDLFGEHCASCHEVIPRENEGDHYKAKKIPLAEVGTDPMTSWSIQNHTSKTLILEGYKADIVVGDKFGPTTRSLDIALNGVVGLVLRNPVKALEAGFITNSVKKKSWDEYVDENTSKRDSIIEEEARLSSSIDQSSLAPGTKNLQGLVYKARPLNGIWATAPYLHNGSVPNLTALLMPPEERPTSFWVGNHEYDEVNVGFVSTSGKNEFKVMKSPNEIMEGNSNRGHDYGTDLSVEDKKALIEFMKSL